MGIPTAPSDLILPDLERSRSLTFSMAAVPYDTHMFTSSTLTINLDGTYNSICGGAGFVYLSLNQ